jgi:hypothetical protein
MTAPQPYRDPTYPPRQRRPEDPLRYDRDKHNQNSEFGFGAGLVPKHLNGRPLARAASTYQSARPLM